MFAELEDNVSYKRVNASNSLNRWSLEINLQDSLQMFKLAGRRNGFIDQFVQFVQPREFIRLS